MTLILSFLKFFTIIPIDIGWTCCLTCIIIEIAISVKKWRGNIEGGDSWKNQNTIYKGFPFPSWR